MFILGNACISLSAALRGTGVCQMKAAVVVLDERPFFGADPQRPGPGCEQLPDPCGPECGGVCGVEDLEPVAVEPDHATGGSAPQKAVWSLSDAAHDVLRQAAVGLPSVDDVPFRRFQGGGREQASGNPEEQQDPECGGGVQLQQVLVLRMKLAQTKWQSHKNGGGGQGQVVME